ncbi:Cadherin-like protein 1 [Sarcoptes scabiei]|uniref:Cadherin-like protein 1 n=1 Tax=Sarcoptes scabiei TaxID=52283 RepID=A0A132A0I4_SARSC|nr:Cadherin-like protein 1 [Sarcoptes scabiei]
MIVSKSTNASIIVNVLDRNDSPPRFLQKDYHIEIDENIRNDYLIDENFDDDNNNHHFNHFHNHNRSIENIDQFPSKVLLRLTVEDNDLPETNRFLFKILRQNYSTRPFHYDYRTLSNSLPLQDSTIHSSKRNKTLAGKSFNHFVNEHFLIEFQPTTKISNHNLENTYGKTSPRRSRISALLKQIQPLDYEIPSHRFILLQIAVTDQGYWPEDDFDQTTISSSLSSSSRRDQLSKADNIKNHIDICFVSIQIRDLNDNKPKFVQNFINLTVLEDTDIGTILARFFATDLDRDGHGPIQYALDENTNSQKYFQIDQNNGFVLLNRKLDREISSLHIVKVIANDLDDPELTSTATLVINVDDVNDNAPFLLNTTLPPVIENSFPTKIGELFAIDLDDYSKGNGPPFTFAIDANADKDILDRFRLEINHSGDGNAILYSKISFDREEQKQYQVPIVVSDAANPSKSSTSLVTVIVGDLNDNQQKDGWKNVLVYFLDTEKILPKTQSSMFRMKNQSKLNITRMGMKFSIHFLKQSSN